MSARWTRKWSKDVATNGYSPIPAQVVSNEEYDPSARRNPVPPDFVSKLKAAYPEEGAQPSLTQYGWVLEG